MSSLLQKRSTYHQFTNPNHPPPLSSSSHKSISIFSRSGLILLLSLMIFLGIFFPWTGTPQFLLRNSDAALSKWRDYTLSEAVSFVGKDGTLIVCAVSEPYLPFLSNWLISISRLKHQEKVLVIAEDYATFYKVNQKWPGHAVLVPPAPDLQTAHKFGSQNELVFFEL